MSQIKIELHEKSTIEKGVREKYIKEIAKQSTEDLRLLYKLATLSKTQKWMIKNHPQVKKFIS